MTSSLCRLCYSANTKLTNSINDDQVLTFLDLVPKIVLADDPCLPIQVCQLCFGKARIATNFINSIRESQKSFARKKPKDLMKRTVPLKVNDVFAKMQRNSGISIKKVFQKDPIGFQEAEERKLDNSQQGEWAFDDESATSSQDIFAIEDSEGGADSDEDFKPYSSRPSTSKAANRSKDIYIDAPITFTCAKCKATFKDFCSLSVHMKERSCFVDVIACNICAKQFSAKRNLYSHMATHRPKPPKFMCEGCGMEFSSTFDLDTHMEATHRRVVKRDCIYRCTHCQESYSSHLDLLEHVKQHSSKKDSPKLCEICARECPNQKSYQAHMLSHREKRTYVCDMCNKGFMKSYQLTQHMHIHTGIKAFVCDLCQRSYAKRDSLRIHKRKEHPN